VLYTSFVFLINLPGKGQLHLTD